jgi:hypothetical protein
VLLRVYAKRTREADASGFDIDFACDFSQMVQKAPTIDQQVTAIFPNDADRSREPIFGVVEPRSLIERQRRNSVQARLSHRLTGLFRHRVRSVHRNFAGGLIDG